MVENLQKVILIFFGSGLLIFGLYSANIGELQNGLFSMLFSCILFQNLYIELLKKQHSEKLGKFYEVYQILKNQKNGAGE